MPVIVRSCREVSMILIHGTNGQSDDRKYKGKEAGRTGHEIPRKESLCWFGSRGVVGGLYQIPHIISSTELMRTTVNFGKLVHGLMRAVGTPRSLGTENSVCAGNPF